MDVNSPLKIDNSILPQNEVQQSNQDVSLFRAIGSASPELNGPIDLKNQYNQMKKSAVATSFFPTGNTFMGVSSQCRGSTIDHILLPA